jgi:hypothetical protein
MAEKYWSGVKGLALNLYASGNGSLCLGTTDHHDTHATLLRFGGVHQVQVLREETMKPRW